MKRNNLLGKIPAMNSNKVPSPEVVDEHKTDLGLRYMENRMGGFPVGSRTLPGRVYNPDNMESVIFADRGKFDFK